MHDGKLRGQFGRFVHHAVTVPVGEDLDSAASTPGHGGDESVIGLVDHVATKDRLILLAAPTPILVVVQEGTVSDGRPQRVFEEIHGEDVGVDGAESRHDRRGQYGPEPVPAEEHERHLNGRRPGLRPRREDARA